MRRLFYWFEWFSVIVVFLSLISLVFIKCSGSTPAIISDNQHVSMFSGVVNE